MEITESTIKKILTRSESGYLLNADGRGPICSHSMQPYQGCAFGNALCGVGCYVRLNTYVTKGREWGSFLEARTNVSIATKNQPFSQDGWGGCDFLIATFESTKALHNNKLPNWY